VAAGRKPVAAGNWKMNTNVEEGLALARALVENLAGIDRAEIVIYPPFTHLVPLAQALHGSGLLLGGQNLHWEAKGAFTGEISAAMLRPLASEVLIGHSERRQYFGESDESVNRKLQAALAVGLRPCVCVGETLEERDAGQVEAVLERQITVGLHGLAADAELLLAYEPVWAIGTGRAATSAQANDAMRAIRRVLGGVVGEARAASVRILYGGSVTPENATELMAQPEIDGALVGGASLKADSFSAIARAIAAAA
jgi:triosephosphate isomerase (TIM)